MRPAIRCREERPPVPLFLVWLREKLGAVPASLSDGREMRPSVPSSREYAEKSSPLCQHESHCGRSVGTEGAFYRRSERGGGTGGAFYRRRCEQAGTGDCISRRRCEQSGTGDCISRHTARDPGTSRRGTELRYSGTTMPCFSRYPISRPMVSAERTCSMRQASSSAISGSTPKSLSRNILSARWARQTRAA